MRQRDAATEPIALGRGWSTSVLGDRAASSAPPRRPGPRAGELVEALPSLAPRTVGEILDTALEVLRARFVTCVGLSACLWLPASALGTFASRSEGLLGDLSAASGVLAQLVVQSLAVALVTVVVYGHMQGHRVRAGRSAAIALRRTPALLVTTVIINVLIFAGTLMLLAPGILLSWLWMVAPAALVLERLRPLQAMGRSARLVRGGFLRWAGTVATETVLVLPFSGIPALLTDAGIHARLRELSGLSGGAFDAAEVLLSALLMGIATALGAVVLTVFYLDCRVRSEGFDLVMRFERLRDRHGGPRDARGLVAGVQESGARA